MKNSSAQYCDITKNAICIDGVNVFASEGDFSSFSKQAMQHFKIDYPKFYKMDNLSKLAFLGAELLLRDLTNETNLERTALVFANRSSSLDTDIKYQDSIADKDEYYPSPGVFVYTLPNICLGEISIRHHLKSENSFFIFEAFNKAFLFKYAEILLKTDKADRVLCGWVEYFKEEYTAHFFLIAQDQQNSNF